MVKIKVRVEGTVPLLMHKFTQADPTSARGKKVYVAEDEAEKAAYRNSDGKLFAPAAWFKAAMVKSGTDYKMEGRKTYKEYVKSGVLINENEIILDQQDYEIHECAVVVQRSRIIRWRPMIKEWSCEFTIEIIDDKINPTVLKQILEFAGKLKGVGDNRPEYGRFVVTKYKKI